MNARSQTGFVERAAWVVLWIFVFSIPLEKTVWVPGIGTIARLLGILAFAAGAVAVVRRGRLRRPNLALLLAALFVLWTALTYFWSLAPALTAAQSFTFAQLLAMLWLIWELCRGPQRQAQLMQAYVGGTVLASLDTLIRYAQGQQTYYRRYAATGFEPNEFGLTVALSIPLALYLAGQARGWMRWAYRGAVVMAISAVYLTASRTALIATFIAFGFMVLTWRTSERSQRVSCAVLFALLILGLVRFAPTASRQRLATIPTELTQGTLHNRTQIWKAGLKVLRRHAILGVGSGAYPEAVRPALGTPSVPGHRYVAHNTFLSVLVECGAIGFAIYALLLGVLVTFVWMMPSAERALWLVMLAVWAAGVSTLTWEQRKPGWLLFALITTGWARSFWPAGKRL